MTRTSRWSVLAAFAAAMALLAIGSGAASACSSRTVTLNGVGSSLQKVAQEQAWEPEYHRSCSEVTLTYSAVGSGEGFKEWGAETGTAGTAERSAKQFLATDDAPNSTQVGNLERSGNGAALKVVPAAQAAIGVIVHRPSGCEVTTITNADLQEIFKGTLTDWERVSTASESGHSCRSSAITRAVRLDKSGTTFQFKHYLWLINEAIVEGRKTWLTLQEPTENTKWPSETSPEVRRPASNGGGALVSLVEANSGFVGYAAVADAIGKTNVTILKVLNGATTGERFAAATTGAEEGSNCASTEYFRELGRGALVRKEETIPSAEWERIYGSNLNIGRTIGSAYPICTLTWDVGYGEYFTAGFSREVGAATGDYFTYIVNGGQSIIGAKHYSALPTAIDEIAKTTAGGVR